VGVLGGAALLAAMAAGPACVDMSAAQYVEREDKRFAVTGKPDVVLSTFDGSIEVQPTTRSEVTVTIEKRAVNQQQAARIEVHTEQTGSHVVVEVKKPAAAERVFDVGWNTSSAKLIVSVPAVSDVSARSGDGSIRIDRVTGTIDLRSGDGSIQGSHL